MACALKWKSRLSINMAMTVDFFSVVDKTRLDFLGCCEVVSFCVPIVW